LEQGRVRIRPAPDSGITLEGEPVGEREIRDDSAGEADVLRLGRLHLTVIRRRDRLGVRVRDPESRVRKEFQGMEYFPPDPLYRVRTRLVPYEPARAVLVPNVLGTPEPMTAPGYVDLDLNGEKVRLVPVLEDPSGRELFFIFGDATNGRETYGAGRFLYADLAEDGTVTVDFNKAYTPPCAFSPYATCPLPPPENRLALRIEAGEKFSGHH
ncbi:MAG: DUF1684 domain-containing protein, partial [Acidobacteria bacterium]|nr:DUF1684 domain-containing protein [Acidobacteriota bacterium]